MVGYLGFGNESFVEVLFSYCIPFSLRELDSQRALDGSGVTKCPRALVVEVWEAYGTL
jgi:hypothetical protein